MWCGKCSKEIINCTCPDIEERLRSLANGPAGPAALQNLAAREAVKAAREDGDASIFIAGVDTGDGVSVTVHKIKKEDVDSGSSE